MTVISEVAADFSGVGNPHPSGRIHLRERHELLIPGSCAVCGSATSIEPYVDPSIFNEWEGQLYFCQTCVREMAAAIGCLDADQSKFLMDLNTRFKSELAEAENELKQLRALRSVILGSPGVVSLLADYLVPYTKADASKQQDESEHASESVTTGTPEQPESDESVKGSNDSGPTRTPKRNVRSSGGTLLT